MRLQQTWRRLLPPRGRRQPQLTAQLTPNTYLPPEQVELRNRLGAQLQQGLQQPGAVKALIANFLFSPPGKLTIANPQANLPGLIIPTESSPTGKFFWMDPFTPSPNPRTCFTRIYQFRKNISEPPALVFPSILPEVHPETNIFPEESVATPVALSFLEDPNCLVHCFVPDELYFTTKRSLLPALEFPSSPPPVNPAT